MNLKTKNILIRICYIIPTLIFIFVLIDELILAEEKFRRVDYAVITATVFFLYQSIRNSVSGWILVMILYLIFLYMLGEGILRSIDYLGAKIDKQTFLIQIGIGLCFMGLGYLYWRIRPKNRLI